MAAKPPAALIRYLSDKRCVLFVGAGLSMWGGMPSWGGLLERLCQEATEGDPDGEEAHELTQLRESGAYLQVAEYCREHLGEFRFLELLRNTLHPKTDEPPLPHRLIVDLPFAGIVTTNYDNLIETAFERLGHSRPRVLTHDDRKGLGSLLFDRSPYVLKAHGDLERPSTLVLTARDYREVIHANPAFAEIFSAILLTHSILFLGYSLSDPDFKLLMDQQLTVFDGNVPPRYALMSGLGRIEREVLWKSANIQVLPYEVEEDHPQGSHHRLLRFLEALGEGISPSSMADDLPAGTILLSSTSSRLGGAFPHEPMVFDESRLREALEKLREPSGEEESGHGGGGARSKGNFDLEAPFPFSTSPSVDEVKVTLGPKGRNIILDKKFGSPALTRETPPARHEATATLSLRLEDDKVMSRLTLSPERGGELSPDEQSSGEAVSGETPVRRLRRLAEGVGLAVDWKSAVAGRALRAVGEDLAGLLAPPVRRALDLLEEGTLLRLETSPELSRWPWEWLRLDGDEHPLALRFALARAPVASSDRTRGRPSVSGAPSVLLIADPSRNLPGARDEAEAVEDAYRARGSLCRALIGSDATTTAVLSLLENSPWDIVHFAGHGWFDEQQAYLQLAGDERLRAGELRFFLGRHPPALLVLNTHYTAFIPPQVNATLEGWPDIHSTRLGRDGFSEIALAAGVGAVVGTFGSISDAVAAEVGSALHGGLLEGLPIAEALRRARPAAPPGGAADPSGLLYTLAGYADLRWQSEE